MSEAVRNNPLTSKVTTCEVEEAIKLWLRGAPDRQGGRAERARRSAAKRKSRHSSARHDRSRSRSRSPVRLNEQIHHGGSSRQSSGDSRHSPPSSLERSTQDRRSGQAVRRSLAARHHSRSRSRSGTVVRRLNEHEGSSRHSTEGSLEL